MTIQVFHLNYFLVSFLCKSSGIIYYEYIQLLIVKVGDRVAHLICEMFMVGAVIDKDANWPKPLIVRQSSRGDGAFGSTGK